MKPPPALAKLDIMLSTQHELQIKAYGQDPATLSTPDKIQFIKDMVLAATDELHELLAETDWKPWTNAWEIRREAAAGELVDLVHFVMNLMLVLGMTPDELYNKYMAKKTINAKRQEDGYDGRSTKCPGCGRALDDPAVGCRKPDKDQVNLLGICIEKGAIFKTPEQIDDEGSASTPYSPPLAKDFD